MTVSERPEATIGPTATSRDVNLLAKGAGISLFGLFGGRLLHMGGQVLLARLLGPSDFGLFVLGLTIFQLGARLGSLGLYGGVIRFGVRARQEGESRLSEVFRNAFFTALVCGLLFGGAVILLAPWLSRHVFKQPELAPVLFWFGLGLTFITWLNVSAGATQITGRMQYSTLAFDVLPVFLSLVLTIVLVYFLNLSSTGAAIAVMVGYAAGVSLSLIFIRHLFPNIKWWGVLSLSKIKELLSFSVPNSLAVMFNQWLLNVTILFLGLHVASSEIGTFQAAEQVSMLSALVLIAFSKVFSPMITDLYEKRDLGRLNELFRVSTKWGLYVCLPLLIVVIFYPSSILRLVYGVGYGTGASVLLIIMMSQIVNTATGSVSSMLSMTGHQKIFLLNAMAAFIACVVLNLVLTPLFGSIGAAVSIGGSIVVLNLLLLWSVRRNLGLWPYDRRYYKLLLALLPTVVVMFLVKEVWPAPTPWELTLAVLASYGIFALSLILLKLEDYELSLLRVTLKRFMRLPIFVNRG